MDLIRYAFEVNDSNVVGELPGWLATKRFDVVAKSSGEALTYSRLRLMVRALLQDRFQLDASFDRVDAPVLALVMERSDGKAGPNLRPPRPCVPDSLVREPVTELMKVKKITSCSAVVGTNAAGLNSVIGMGVTMEEFARLVSRFGRFDRPIVDQTGLSGEFYIVVVASADIPGATNDARFVTAMREQLGLTLRAKEGSLDVLRIRRIKQPSQN